MPDPEQPDEPVKRREGVLFFQAYVHLFFIGMSMLLTGIVFRPVCRQLMLRVEPGTPVPGISVQAMRHVELLVAAWVWLLPLVLLLDWGVLWALNRAGIKPLTIAWFCIVVLLCLAHVGICIAGVAQLMMCIRGQGG